MNRQKVLKSLLTCENIKVKPVGSNIEIVYFSDKEVARIHTDKVYINLFGNYVNIGIIEGTTKRVPTIKQIITKWVNNEIKGDKQCYHVSLATFY